MRSEGNYFRRAYLTQEKRQLTVRLPPEELLEMNIKALRQHTSLQKVARELLNRWLSSPGESSTETMSRDVISVSAESYKWHTLLMEVLARGGVGAEEVQSAILKFSDPEVTKTSVSTPDTATGLTPSAAAAIKQSEDAIKRSREARKGDRTTKRRGA